MRLKILLLINIVLLIQLSEQSANLTVEANTSFIKDSYGRIRIYHGVNVVYKTAPYYPPVQNEFNPMLSFSEEDAKLLNSWGFNQIRLYASWDGYETAPGQFNQTYLEQVQKIVRLCNKYNISVLLDLHQDLFSFYFCGEGVPDFYVTENTSFPQPMNITLQRNASTNYPLNSDCRANAQPFAKYYFTYDVAQFSQDWTLNKNNLTDKSALFWKNVASFFKNEPNVIGYELLNEPWGISQYDKPLDWIRMGHTNNKYLLPFYRIMNNQIRSVDNDSLVFYEPLVFDFLSYGFSENVGGPAYQSKEVFAYHIYCPLVNQNGAPFKPLYQFLCSLFDSFEFSTKYSNAKKIQAGSFLTEFGATDNSTDSIKELNRILDGADQRYQSWSYWQYKYYNDITTASPSPDVEGFWDSNGNMQSNKVKTLSRPYASAICGTPLQMEYQPLFNRFVLSIEYTGECNQRYTEISIGGTWYFPQGIQYSFINCASCKLQNINGPFYQIINTSTLSIGSQFTLTIRSK